MCPNFYRLHAPSKKNRVLVSNVLKIFSPGIRFPLCPGCFGQTSERRKSLPKSSTLQ